MAILVPGPQHWLSGLDQSGSKQISVSHFEESISSRGDDLHAMSDEGEIQDGGVVSVDRLNARKIRQRPQLESTVGAGRGCGRGRGGGGG